MIDEISETGDWRGLIQRILDERPGDRNDVFLLLVQRAAAVSNTRMPAASELVARYTSICAERIARAPEVPGTGEALRVLDERDHKMYVNSATPDQPLNELVGARGLAHRFRGTFGSNASKIENLRTIAYGESAKPAEVVVVGDGDDDCGAAARFGCRFVRIGAARHPEETALPDLHGLPSLLSQHALAEKS